MMLADWFPDGDEDEDIENKSPIISSSGVLTMARVTFYNRDTLFYGHTINVQWHCSVNIWELKNNFYNAVHAQSYASCVAR